MEEIRKQAKTALEELIAAAKLQAGDIVVVGCSSSEIIGEKIGTMSSVETAAAVFDEIYRVIKAHGLYLAAQCCEHLNRALIVEEACAKAYGLECVNVVPQPKAGGAFATQAYNRFDRPVAVEHIRAHAGLDIGGTLIGMHLKEVAVPLRISIRSIGEAPIFLARTRPKFIGGVRAHYNEDLL
ncbi:TIGR01440 family protein [Zongyangia hominis]|uniref:UPF0340 protein H8709_09800 n=1 Tax=Zongyangia hominis TaxID=2763677 RepID=A0A926EFH7_9FIRM|nr:TIGR01440 family protein [Zongyangia hominis]MBC8571116.1 TIGR01440 family protein [Zongyangia hominis]